MHLPQISLLLTVALGFTQVLAIPTSDTESTEVASRGASAQLSPLNSRASHAPACPLGGPCNTCGKVQLKKGSKKLKQPCKGKHCRREEVGKEVEKRASGVIPIQSVYGWPWGPEDGIGTENLNSCTFIAICDTDYVAGTHIPPGVMNRDQHGTLIQTASAAQQIDSQLRLLSTHLQHIHGQKLAYMLTANRLHEEERTQIRNWFGYHGFLVREQIYNPDELASQISNYKGEFWWSRLDNAWPPFPIGPV